MQEIKNGIALLDKKRPGWCEKIDLEILDLGSTFTCVLGQLYKEDFNALSYRTQFLHGTPFGLGVSRLKLENASDYGFDSSAHNSYGRLETGWKRAIKGHCG